MHKGFKEFIGSIIQVDKQVYFIYLVACWYTLILKTHMATVLCSETVQCAHIRFQCTIPEMCVCFIRIYLLYLRDWVTYSQLEIEVYQYTAR